MDYHGLAPFWDMDFDGIYEPEQGAYPIFSVRDCLAEEPAIPSELLFFPIVLTSSTDEESQIKLFMTVARYGCEEGSSVINILFLSTIRFPILTLKANQKP